MLFIEVYLSILGISIRNNKRQENKEATSTILLASLENYLQEQNAERTCHRNDSKHEKNPPIPG